MYNLELTIENWRNGLLAQGSILHENVEELEDHLRTSISQLVKQGLSEDEAFLIASKRVGSSSNLNIEFSKVNTVTLWVQRLCWMILGILSFQAFSGIWMFIAEVTSESMLVFSKSATTSGVLFIVMSVLLPFIAWMILRDITHVDSVIYNRLKLFFKLIIENQKPWAGLLACVFLVIPIAEFLLLSTVIRNLSPRVLGEYSLIVSWYRAIAGALFPVFGILILFWLNRSRNRYPATK